MALAALSSEALDFYARVDEAYAKLLARGDADPKSGLGGRLYYAGELNDEGRALVVAASIAGAATLAASANRDAQKQAIRDGVADFLVNSLDEALRILKNQLRKRETAAVSVAIEPAELEREMYERGVAPDLVLRCAPMTTRHEAIAGDLMATPAFATGADHEADLASASALVVWRTGSARLSDLALLDGIALSCLDADEWAARRWLRLAPRFLGRLAQGLRLLSTHREFAVRFSGQLSAGAARGEIAFPYEVRTYIRGTEENRSFDSGKS